MANPIQVQKFLKGVNYPADKNKLVAQAKQNGADQNVMSIVQQLPEHTYNRPSDVSKEIGKIK